MNGPRGYRLPSILMLFAVLPLFGTAPVDAQERDRQRDRGMDGAREHRPADVRHRVRLSAVNGSGIRGMALFRGAAGGGMKAEKMKAGEAGGEKTGKAAGERTRGERAGAEPEKEGKADAGKAEGRKTHEGMRHGEMAHRKEHAGEHGPMRVVLRLTGLTAGSSYPAHIHRGSCESGGPPAVPLEAVTAGEGATGTSTTEIDTERLREMHEDGEDPSFFVQVHRPDGAPAACGDVGMEGKESGR